MKIYYIIFTLLLTSSHVIAQANYPVPKETPTRLFYIQHSNNHNTFVYDANVIKDSINNDNPVHDYRIEYADNGQVKPLSEIQKLMAYGLTITYISPNLYEMYLAANKDKLLYLTLDKNLKPVVYTTINKRKMYLDKLFVQIKADSSEFDPDVEYLLFIGTDFNTKKAVTEKYLIPE
ncbi:DUF4833 domain-containing protein [Bizionia arctica]|uniref:DUF4833 domain-containing protein n=1 Tax=Bizionia arctica TaxID=1495645 RepID=A0A917LQ36_9FLAO|nr:DUF4833 domain-containing protein [Bizionia arctica]GGG50422.1 DUF4833 domain-containing protein [Bizionia arctica]